MEINEFKKYLKTLNKEYIKKLFVSAELNDIEHGIAYNAIIAKEKVDKICMDYNISRSQYFVLYKQILLKLLYTIKNTY